MMQNKHRNFEIIIFMLFDFRGYCGYHEFYVTQRQKHGSTVWSVWYVFLIDDIKVLPISFSLISGDTKEILFKIKWAAFTNIIRRYQRNYKIKWAALTNPLTSPLTLS
jgi:hypothetical protein